MTLSAQFTNPILAGNNLARTVMQSPNFVAGVSGWAIFENGDAEFNSIVIPPGSGGATIFIQGSTPTAKSVGDIWFNSSNGFEVSQWNGSAWVAFQYGTGALGAGSITAALIAANTITAAQIAAGTITATQIAAGTITTGNISAGAITTTLLAANAVTAAKIAANTITASQIAANTITASQLAAGIIYAGIIDSTTVKAGTLIAEGSNGSFLGYSSTPASGDLVASVTGDGIGFSDGNGNFVFPGHTAYSEIGSTFYALQMAATSPMGITLSSSLSPASGWSTAQAIQFDGTNNVAFVGNGGAFFELGPDSSGYPVLTDENGMTLNISGSKLANPAGSGPYPITVSNASATSLGFMTVPQGDVETGTTYDIHATGFFSTGASVPSSAVFNLHWGGIAGTNIGSLTIPGTILANASTLGWTFDAEANWASTTEVIVTITVGWHTATGVGGSTVYFTVSDTTGLVTNSGNKNLSLGFVWGTAPSGTSLTCNAFRAGRLG